MKPRSTVCSTVTEQKYTDIQGAQQGKVIQHSSLALVAHAQGVTCSQFVGGVTLVRGFAIMRVRGVTGGAERSVNSPATLH